MLIGLSKLIESLFDVLGSACSESESINWNVICMSGQSLEILGGDCERMCVVFYPWRK